jgi:hypothetical protein
LGAALQTVKTFRDPWDAHLFRTRLAADGVPAFVTDDIVIGMRWYLSTAFGGVRVQVPNDSYEAARASLHRCATGEYTAELAEMFGDLDLLLCPNCGSENIRCRPSIGELLFGATFLLLGMAAKLQAKRCTCRVCGTRWVDARYEK